jgi:DNA primase
VAKAEALGIEDVGEVLRDIYQLRGDILKGEYRCLCPVHEMDGAGHKPSCDVSLATGYWNCFSCPASGDIVDLGVVLIEGLGWDFRKKPQWRQARIKILKLLKSDEPDALTASIKRRLRDAKRLMEPSSGGKAQYKPIIPPVDAYLFKYPKFLRDRGFNEETLRRWKIRYVEEATLMKDDGSSFTITEAVAIPIFDKKKLIGWCYRATPKSEKWFQNIRYIYTPGITDVLSHLWFGMNMHSDVSEIAVVEGALDAIWCDQNGIPAVAILGSQVKQLPKIRQLMDFRKVVLFTDRDVSGATTAYHLGLALQERGVGCSVVRYQGWMGNRRGEQAKDAQDLCGLDIELSYARAIPFLAWKRSNRAA